MSHSKVSNNLSYTITTCLMQISLKVACDICPFAQMPFSSFKTFVCLSLEDIKVNAVVNVKAVPVTCHKENVTPHINIYLLFTRQWETRQ